MCGINFGSGGRGQANRVAKNLEAVGAEWDEVRESRMIWGRTIDEGRECGRSAVRN